LRGKSGEVGKSIASDAVSLKVLPIHRPTKSVMPPVGDGQWVGVVEGALKGMRKMRVAGEVGKSKVRRK